MCCLSLRCVCVPTLRVESETDKVRELGLRVLFLKFASTGRLLDRRTPWLLFMPECGSQCPLYRRIIPSSTSRQSRRFIWGSAPASRLCSVPQWSSWTWSLQVLLQSKHINIQTQNSEEDSSSLFYHFYSYSTFLVYQDFDFESDNVHCSHSNNEDGHHSEVQIPSPSSPASPGRKGSNVPFILSELSLYSWKFYAYIYTSYWLIHLET